MSPRHPSALWSHGRERLERLAQRVRLCPDRTCARRVRGPTRREICSGPVRRALCALATAGVPGSSRPYSVWRRGTARRWRSQRCCGLSASPIETLALPSQRSHVRRGAPRDHLAWKAITSGLATSAREGPRRPMDCSKPVIRASDTRLQSHFSRRIATILRQRKRYL